MARIKARLLKAQQTDQQGVILPIGTVVEQVAEGEFVNKKGQLCWPAPNEVEIIKEEHK